MGSSHIRSTHGAKAGRARLFWLLLLGPWLCLGCSDEPLETTEQPPVLLIGVDGLEWDVLLPMLRRGELPRIAELMERGVFGKLETLQPTLSPVIWTTIATGKSPAQHGIRNFAHVGADGRPILFTNRDRRTKALWNIANDYGKRVAVVGWWMTYPVDAVNGVMVAQTNTLDQLDTKAGRHVLKGRLYPDLPGQVHPPERLEQVSATLAEADRNLERWTEEVFGRFPRPLSTLGDRLWQNCRWAFRADATYVAVAKELLSEAADFDLVAVYLGGPDVVGHRFWRYHAPELYAHPPSPDDLASLGPVLEREYIWIDSVIGELVDAMGSDARVLVVSDHGMQPIALESPFDATGGGVPEDVNSAHHREAPPGVLIAAGPDFAAQTGVPELERLERRDLAAVCGVMDLTPTLLALLDVPLGLDMPGRVAENVLERDFLRRHPPRGVASHDTEAWIRAHRRATDPPPGAEERIDQLRALGYLDSE